MQLGSTLGSDCWCDAQDGSIPPDAVVGGDDGGPLYIGRADHEGALLPGKVSANHGVCYVAWGGQEHAKNQYQVRIIAFSFLLPFFCDRAVFEYSNALTENLSKNLNFDLEIFQPCTWNFSSNLIFAGIVAT